MNVWRIVVAGYSTYVLLSTLQTKSLIHTTICIRVGLQYMDTYSGYTSYLLIIIQLSVADVVFLISFFGTSRNIIS